MSNHDDHPDGESEARIDAKSFDRRRYLQLLGAAGFVTGGSTTGTAAAGDSDRTVEIPDDGDWEASAERRIREHRTGELAVEVTDADGRALEVPVAVEMREHEFGFGTAVNADALIDGSEEGDAYREYIPELFNKAVLENHHKWRFWESNRELADAATDWLLERGLDVRGHAVLWSNVGAWAVPPDVVSAMGVEWEDNGVTDPELDPDHVRERSFDHLETIVSHYGDDIEEWDVVNEVIHEPGMIEAIDGEDVDSVEAPVLAEWYEAAEAVARDDVGVDVNDYNTLAGPYDYARDAYERQIEFLIGEGVGLNGIGMQCHFSAGETLTPGEILEGLDRYAGYGADLRLTEFDTADDGWDDENKADFLYQFLKTVYSHPATADFLMWGFWDGEHWQGEAPLFYEDWEPKPAYDVYTDLVFEEWWTSESGTTDDGTYTARAFLGDHDLTVSVHDAIDLETSVTVAEPTNRTVAVTVVDIDVRGAAGGRRNGKIPVRVSGGDAFDPATLDLETVRFGAPGVVNDGGGSAPRRRERCGGRNGSSTLLFDAEESALEGGVAMLSGRTGDGRLVVGADEY